MITTDIDAILTRQPPTKDLSPEQIQVIASCATVRTLMPGEYLWRQGEQSGLLYLIESGEVALEISVPGQGPLLIEIINSGEIVGCSNLLTSSRCQYDARALTPVSCAAIELARLCERMERDERLGYALLKRLAPMMAHKLESARLRLFEVNGIDRFRSAGSDRSPLRQRNEN